MVGQLQLGVPEPAVIVLRGVAQGGHPLLGMLGVSVALVTVSSPSKDEHDLGDCTHSSLFDKLSIYSTHPYVCST